ncbi:MAG: TIM barrel protein [Egibacteraceae bacterium]
MMSTADEPRVRLGSAPDSWGVWLPDDDRQVPWERFLDEISLAGYEWLELGPYSYLPTDTGQLQDELKQRDLRCSGQAVFAPLHHEDGFEESLPAARAVAELTTAVGGEYVILLPGLHTDEEGERVEPRELDADAWKRLVDGNSRLGKLLHEEYGVTLVFHSHADSHVESQEQIERFLADTDPAYVQLCLDTGHVAYGGADNFEIIARYPERIGYVHLKAMDPQILRQVVEEGLSFAQAVKRGVCVEPPAGVPDMRLISEALQGLDVELFAIVEQDLFGCSLDLPLPIARRTRGHLRSCGIGVDVSRE